MAARDTMISTRRSQEQSTPFSTYQLAFFNNSSDAWCFRDHSKKFVYMNSTFARCLGVQHPVFMLGRKLEEMATSLDESKSRLLNVEKEAVDYSSKKSCILLMLSPLNFKRILSSVIFYPLYDEGGVFMGTCWQLCECSISPFSAVKSKSLKPSELTGSPNSPYDVYTRKEWDIAWPLAMGWSKLDISHSLGLSSEYIRKATTRLYAKIDVNNFEAFQAKVYSLGWLNEIPTNTPYITK